MLHLHGDPPRPDIRPNRASRRIVMNAITLAELSVAPHVTHDETERSARQQHLQQAEADFDVLPFDADCARAFGAVAAALRASGRKPAARAYDVLIAASAIAHALPPYTCNAADFAGFRGSSSGPSPILITCREVAISLLSSISEDSG